MNMKMHFLNVGNGDCTVIELPDGSIMVVDICNGGGDAGDLENPVRYLRNVKTIFRYVQTHPEMDHMEGLAELSSQCSITNFWDTAHNRPKPDFNTQFSVARPADWNAYQRLRKEAKNFYRGTDRVTLQNGTLPYDLYVLHPTRDAVMGANAAEDWNRISYVLLLQYKYFKLLLGGDADNDTWQEIFQWASSDPDAKSLLSNINVFKVSHHGRKTSYCGADILRLTSPQQIIISKGSVPREQSAYGSYYNKVGSENLHLTSRGNVIVDYDPDTNKYDIK